MSDAGNGVPAGQQQSWGAFLKSLANFSGDLSALTAPSFILSPTSLLEFSGYWGEHPATLAEITEPEDPVERFLKVVKFFVGTLKGAYTARNEESGSEKKPLNPVLGEQFLGKWPNEASNGKGETILISEQVSHHPPISAYHLENQQANVALEGHNGQKTAFSKGSIIVKQVGHAMVHTSPPGKDLEAYLITLPTVTVEGLWYGKPYIELCTTSYISSSSGYLATLEFSGKGYFSGKRHQLKIIITPIKEPKNVLYTIQGDWTAQTHYVGKSPSGQTNELFWDAQQEPRIPVSVKPLEEQAEYESRRLWHTVAQGITSSQYDVANKHKAEIEQHQRELRKQEQDGQKPPHENKLFTLIEDDPEYATLAAYSGHEPAHEATYRRKGTSKGSEAL